MTFKNKILFVLLFFSTLSYMGCNEPQTTEVSPEFAIPLINSALSLQNILDEANTGDIVQVDGDNFITVSYRKEVLSTDTVNLVQIPGFSIPQLTTNQTIPMPFPSDFDIDKITIKNGKLYINFESNSLNPITVELRVPTIKKNGTQLTHTMNVTNTSGSVPFMYQDSVDLAAYQMNFTNGNFKSEYDATDDVTNLPTVLSSFFLDFPVIDHSYIEGYFGQVGFTLPTEELILGLFEQWTEGQITFTDPRIRLKFDNSYGFPLNVTFDTLQAFTRDGGQIDLGVSGFTNGKDLNYPSLTEVGLEKASAVVINKDNSNITSILENVPYGLRHQFSGQANKTGNQNIRGFATDESKLSLTVIAELPMEGAVSNFTLIDTFALDLTNNNIPEGDAEFKIITNNGFPLDIDLQCYFLNDFGIAIDSMFLGSNISLIEAAPVDADGKVITPLEKITFSGFTRDRINLIRENVRNIALKGSFSSTNNGNTDIKLYADYHLGVQIGVKVKPVID